MSSTLNADELIEEGTDVHKNLSNININIHESFDSDEKNNLKIGEDINYMNLSSDFNKSELTVSKFFVFYVVT